MLKKTIKYTDFNGDEHSEEFYFNLTKSEIMEMEMSTAGGMEQRLKRMMNTKDTVELAAIFKDIILRSYGEKSDDGKRFIKARNGVRLANEFVETAAYDELFMELLDAEKCAEFINGIMPADVQAELQKHPELKEGNVVSIGNA